MATMKIILFLILISTQAFCGTYNAFKDYSKGKYKEAEEKLKMEQVDSPFNTMISYNLGVVQYREGKFNEAKESFLMAEKSTDKSTYTDWSDKRSTFNLGNSLYKNTLSILGPGWEKKKLEDKVLESAISEVKQSIEKYKKLPSWEERATVNLKYAEELLKKLTEKQQNQDKPDQSDKDDKKDKDKPDQSEKDQDNNKKDDSKDKSKDQPDQPDPDKSGKDKQKDQDKSKKDESGKKDTDQSDTDKSGTDQSGTDQPETDQPETDKSELDKSSGDKQDQELKNMGALLNRLQENEKKLQKALISKQLESNIRKDTNQKNW